MTWAKRYLRPLLGMWVLLRIVGIYCMTAAHVWRIPGVGLYQYLFMMLFLFWSGVGEYKKELARRADKAST